MTAIHEPPTGRRASPTSTGLLTVAITPMAAAVTSMAPVTSRAEPARARRRGITKAPATAPIPTMPSRRP